MVDDYWQHAGKGNQQGRDHGFGTVQSRKSAFGHTERTRLMEIGSQLRGARPAVRARLLQEVDELVGDRDMTHQDIRLIATYAQHGAALDSDEGSTPAHWKTIAEITRAADVRNDSESNTVPFTATTD